MQALYQATKQKVIEDPQMIQELLNILQDYLVTDLNTKEIMKLATWATQWDISDLEFTSLPGECVEGDLHDEFWVDEEAKRQLMRERFYRSE
jgi:anionic cell wall polymer biosynthesis LytR-Cps2A-Psr (LCP) family protein